MHTTPIGVWHAIMLMLRLISAMHTSMKMELLCMAGTCINFHVLFNGHGE